MLLPILEQRFQSINQQLQFANRGTAVKTELDSVVNGLMVDRFDLDQIWFQLSKTLFEAIVYSQLAKAPDMSLSISILQKLCQDENRVFDLLVAPTHFAEAVLNDQLAIDLTVLSVMIKKPLVFRQVLILVQQRLMEYWSDHQHDQLSDIDFDDPQTDQNVNLEGTIKVRYLLHKYHYTDTSPVVFSILDHPEIDLKALLNWCQKNKVVIATKQEQQDIICCLARKYWQLYLKLTTK